MATDAMCNSLHPGTFDERCEVNMKLLLIFDSLRGKTDATRDAVIPKCDFFHLHQQSETDQPAAAASTIFTQAFCGKKKDPKIEKVPLNIMSHHFTHPPEN